MQMFLLHNSIPRDIMIVPVEMTDEPAEAEKIMDDKAALLMGLSFP